MIEVIVAVDQQASEVLRFYPNTGGGVTVTRHMPIFDEPEKTIYLFDEDKAREIAAALMRCIGPDLQSVG